MIAVGDLAREATPTVLLLVGLADEGTGVGRTGDDPDLWRAAEILELLHRHLASGWPGVQGQIVRYFGRGGSRRRRRTIIRAMTRRGKVIRFPTRPTEPRDARSLVAVHRCVRAGAEGVKSRVERGGVLKLLT